jgi:hypothetical protein
MTSVPVAAEWRPTPKIEDMYANANGSFFASINRPTAGSRVDKELPTGDAPIQLYSLQTPTGVIIYLFSA